MTVSISRMNIEYYLSTTAMGDGKLTPVKDLTSYYYQTGSPEGRWFGAGLSGISMTDGQAVQRHHARRLFDDLMDPLTGQPLGRRPIKTVAAPSGAKTPTGDAARSKREAVAGFDLTFSVPKSVSVLWALADTATQGRLYAAHQAAIAQTISWLEKEVIQARSGHAGVAHVDVSGVIGTAFDHWDSRAGDPQLHTHAVIANRVQRVEDGQWVTLDSYTLFKHVVTASELYNGLLFDEVQRRTGAVAEQRDGEVVFMLDQVKNGETPVIETGLEKSKSRVELAGIPDELIDHFSTRACAVEIEKDQLVEEFQEKYGRTPDTDELLKIRQQATISTRTAKPLKAKPLSLQMLDWKKRTYDQGFMVNEVVANALAGQATVIDADTLPDTAIGQISEYVLSTVSAKRPTFNKANVHAATSRLMMTVRCRTPKERLALIDRITTAVIDQAVQLSPHRMGIPAEQQSNLVRNGHSIFDQPESWLYSTTELLAQEAFLQQEANTQGGPFVPDSATLTEHLAALEVGGGHHLATDQAQAAQEVITSPQRINAIIGPAGTGKTTTMRGIHSAWTQHYGAGSVVGLAPSAVAASVLGEEVGMATDNITKWLYESIGEGARHRAEAYRRLEAKREDLTQRIALEPRNTRLAGQLDSCYTALAKSLADQAKYTMKENQLLIVDEASMASTADLAALTAQAATTGAKVLLVGDPAQLEAVDAGGFLGWMERANKSSTLNSVWRFKNDWEADASLKLRQGDTDVISTYRDNGRISDCEPGQANHEAYKAWLATTTEKPESSSILIGADNESVHDLNTQAQADLLALGHVTQSPRPAKLRSSQAHVDDKLLTRKNDRRILDANGVFVKNGSRFTVTKILSDGSVMATRDDDTKAVIQIPASYLASSTELGYAVTAHRSQGVTVDYAYCAVKEGLGRELLYVGMTRGKHLNRLFVELPEQTEEHTPDKWGIYVPERKDQADHDQVIAGIMDNSTAVKLAHEERNAAHGAANSVSRLASEYEHLTTAIKTRQLTEWIEENTNTPHVLRDLQRSPNWNRMVRNWPQDTPFMLPAIDPSAPVRPVAELIELELLSQVVQQPEVFENLLPKAQPGTEEEHRIASILEKKLSERLSFLSRDVLAENPAWSAKLNTPGGHEADPELLRAVVLWREMADQQELEDPYGRPTGQKRLEHYFDKLQTVVDRRQRPWLFEESAFDDNYMPYPDDHFDFDWMEYDPLFQKLRQKQQRSAPDSVENQVQTRSRR